MVVFIWIWFGVLERMDFLAGRVVLFFEIRVWVFRVVYVFEG